MQISDFSTKSYKDQIPKNEYKIYIYNFNY